MGTGSALGITVTVGEMHAHVPSCTSPASQLPGARSAEQTPRLPAAPVGGLQDPGVSKRGFAGVTPSPRQPMSSGQALVSLFTDDSNQLEPSTGTRATSGS